MDDEVLKKKTHPMVRFLTFPPFLLGGNLGFRTQKALARRSWARGREALEKKGEVGEEEEIMGKKRANCT